MRFINVLGLVASATVASALATNGSAIQKLPGKNEIIDCNGPDKYDGTAVAKAAEQAWSMWLKGDKKGHDDNMFGEEYPHSSIPLEFGDSFKNGCDNVAGSVIQFPIIGDGVYDGSQEQGEDRVALKDLGDKKSALFCGLVTMRGATEGSRGVSQYRMC